MKGLSIQAANWSQRAKWLPPDKGNYKGPIGEGVRFEQKLGEAVSDQLGNFCSIKLGPWIEYWTEDAEDANGEFPERGSFCQPDIVLEQSKRIVIIECKRSATMKGVGELESLYVPLIEHMFPKKTVIGVCAFKIAKPGIEYSEGSLKKLLELPNGSFFRAEV